MKFLKTETVGSSSYIPILFYLHYLSVLVTQRVERFVYSRSKCHFLPMLGTKKSSAAALKKNEKKVCIWWGLITTLDFIAARIHLHDSFIHSFSIGSKSHTVHGCHGMKMRVGRTDAVVVCVDARIQCGNGMRWRQ